VDGNNMDEATQLHPVVVEYSLITPRVGCWLLVVGCWLLVVLVVGRSFSQQAKDITTSPPRRRANSNYF
jgi:hypothetical protein